MNAISSRKLLLKIATDQAVHPIQLCQSKKQLLKGASELFTLGKKTLANRATV